MIQVYVYGAYRNRQPLAYAPITDRLGDRIALTEAPEDARILLIAHHVEFKLFGARIWDILDHNPQLRVVLLSEEPRWDSLWMPDPLEREQSYDTGQGVIPFTALNHHTSQIYCADHIPYFLLTDPRFCARYKALFARNAGLGAADWAAHFKAPRHDAVFLNKRRDEPMLEPSYPAADLLALSGYRSAVAAKCEGPRVVRAGEGWDDAPPRQDLPDWHEDKLARYDMSCRYMSAFENTHQCTYISEKFYDAMALGAVPLYVASDHHAIHRLVGSDGWLNFFDQLEPVPTFDSTTAVDDRTCDAYAKLQARLAQLFDDGSALEAEYERFCAALVEELGQAMARDV